MRSNPSDESGFAGQVAAQPHEGGQRASDCTVILDGAHHSVFIIPNSLFAWLGLS